MAEIHLLFPTPVYSNMLELSPKRRWMIQSYLDDQKWIFNKDVSGRDNGQYLDDRDILSHEFMSDIADHIDKQMFNYVHQFLKVSTVRHTLKRTNSWANRHYRGDYCHEHCHTNSSFSGVYYLSVPPKSGESLVFKRSGYSWTTDAWEYDLKESTHQNDIVTSFNVYDNLILLFPSHLYHFVPASEADEPRYSIAFNYFLYGEFGRGTNYLRVSG